MDAYSSLLVSVTEAALREVSRVLKPRGIVASSFGEVSFKEIYEAMSEADKNLNSEMDI